MGKTLRYGSKGNRVALLDRMDRFAIHRRTDAWYQHSLLADRTAAEVAFEVSPGQRRVPPNYVTYRDTAPGFGRRLPSR